MVSIQINEALLDEKLALLEAARNWSPRVISRLENMIFSEDDEALFRINPLQFATEKRMSENEAIDLFLYGTKHGLFEMDWHIICAFCGNLMASFKELANLHPHFVCNVCSAKNDLSLDNYIQVSFTISPQIREIIFHDPQSLSIEDYIFKYHLAKGIVVPEEWPSFDEIVKSQYKAMSYIESGEKNAFDIEIEPGVLMVRVMDNDTAGIFIIGDDASADQCTIQAKLVEGQLHFPDLTMASQDISIGDALFKFKQIGTLENKHLLVEFENLSSTRKALLFWQTLPGVDPVPLPFGPCLTGKRLLTTQTFRDLFRSERVQTDEGIDVQDITFLFTDLKGSTAMYDRIGDLNAYHLVRQHFDTLTQVITQNSGAVVKTIGDAVMAAFMNPLDAAKAAIEMIREIEEFNRTISGEIILKVGIHRGPSIAVTLNDRLDYFGQTVNIAARVQGLAGAGEIYTSSDVRNYPGMDDILSECEIVPEQANVKGVSEMLDVCKITVPK